MQPPSLCPVAPYSTPGAIAVLLGPWGSSQGSRVGLRALGALLGPAVGCLGPVGELNAVRGRWPRGSCLGLGHLDGRCGYGPALRDTGPSLTARPPAAVLGGTGCLCRAAAYRKGNCGVFFLVVLF